MEKLKNKEPDFKDKPIEWVSWNVKTTGNSLHTAVIILRQKQILASF